nr:MAG TPA: hypothetical protein [Caudoviricetes sp.]
MNAMLPVYYRPDIFCLYQLTDFPDFHIISLKFEIPAFNSFYVVCLYYLTNFPNMSIVFYSRLFSRKCGFFLCPARNHQNHFAVGCCRFAEQGKQFFFFGTQGVRRQGDCFAAPAVHDVLNVYANLLKREKFFT